MSVLKSIERKIEGLVEGVFGRTFKSSVQPVELAHKLAKEMGDHKTVSVSKIYVPNEYGVYLSKEDFEQLQPFEASLKEELATYLIAFARREGWTLATKPQIELHADDDLHLGEFGIATRTVADPERQEIAPEAAPRLAQTMVYQPPAPVAPPAPAAAPPVVQAALCAVVEVGDRAYELARNVTLVGRSKQCDIVVPDPNVSRRHAEIRREGADYVVIDLDSTNGVMVNGRGVKRAALASGDTLELGTTRLRFDIRPC